MRASAASVLDRPGEEPHAVRRRAPPRASRAPSISAWSARRLDLDDERRLARLAAHRSSSVAVPHLERHGLAADEADLVRPVDRRLGAEAHVDGVHAPAVARRGRAHRPPAPLRERAKHVVERAPVRGQLVDRDGRGRRQLRPPDDAGALEVAKPPREDVRADARAARPRDPCSAAARASARAR